MKDARLDELRFLSRLEREGSITFSNSATFEPVDIKIAIQLLAAGLVNDATVVPSHDEAEFRHNRAGEHIPYRTRIAFSQWEAIGLLHRKQEVRIQATHAAAVRRADLEQSIQRDRVKDATGILLDGRYADRDLQIAIFSASATTPVSVAFLDMNGLKQFNDVYGHDAGDEAIRSFFEVIDAVTAETGEAYRVGGDEVLILFSDTELEQAAELMRLLLRGLANRHVSGQALSAVAGITAVTDAGALPADVKKQADATQYRAKHVSKSRLPDRFGALAIVGREAIEEFHPTQEAHYSAVEQRVLQDVGNEARALFHWAVLPCAAPLRNCPLPMTRDHQAALVESWGEAVAVRRWEQIALSNVTTKTNAPEPGGPLADIMGRALVDVVMATSTTLSRYASAGGPVIEAVASLEAASKEAIRWLAAASTHDPDPERVSQGLEPLCDALVTVLNHWARLNGPVVIRFHEGPTSNPRPREAE